MIYFDNSATTKPYLEVLDSFIKVAGNYFGNPSSLHGVGGQAEKLLNQARTQTAELLGVKPDEILFTSGGTESNNLAIKGVALAGENRGRHIISSKIEHPSVSTAMEQLEKLGFEVSFVPVDAFGFVNPEDIRRELRNDTILVSVMHVNNETGAIQPIKEIGAIVRDYPKVLFHVDYVQGAGKVPLDFHLCGIDLCSLSGHKFHGLKGTGALYVREGVRLFPLFSGGSQEKARRSGTENVAGAVALAKALRMSLAKREAGVLVMEKLNLQLRSELGSIPGVTIHSSEWNNAPHILNFSIKGLKTEVFVHALEEKNIFVSTTSACSSKKNRGSKTLLAMGVPHELAASAVRISLSYENTLEEAKIVGNAIKETVNRLGEVMNR
ncbi:cysteine desulfurase family protein [Mesobacillus zeae]|uniref:Cysteine desulfurase n=1 Tax=Mesobacillus zeae TaxID=1917180 RepID=A0A398AZV4_9BACI|nr:cysteine desulfurase family protein [Mesobacillus zeae]RID83127.1 cysteine desulfurase [Mesobacillus zeae]